MSTLKSASILIVLLGQDKIISPGLSGVGPSVHLNSAVPSADKRTTLTVAAKKNRLNLLLRSCWCKHAVLPLFETYPHQTHHRLLVTSTFVTIVIKTGHHCWKIGKMFYHRMTRRQTTNKNCSAGSSFICKTTGIQWTMNSERVDQLKPGFPARAAFATSDFRVKSENRDSSFLWCLISLIID